MGLFSAVHAQANYGFCKPEFERAREEIVALLDDVEPRRKAQEALVIFDALEKRVLDFVGSE